MVFHSTRHPSPFTQLSLKPEGDSRCVTCWSSKPRRITKRAFGPTRESSRKWPSTTRYLSRLAPVPNAEPDGANLLLLGTRVCLPLAHPQTAARNMLISVEDPVTGPLKLAGNPMKLSDFADPPNRSPAPDLDADRDKILHELGL